MAIVGKSTSMIKLRRNKNGKVVYYTTAKGRTILKRCTDCGHARPLAQFNSGNDSIDKSYTCRTCDNQRTKKYDASPRGKATQFIRNQNKRIEAMGEEGLAIENDLQVWEAQWEYGETECNYCGRDLAPNEVVIDHPITYKRKGANSFINIIACCQRCNARKGKQSFYTFLMEHVSEYYQKQVVFKLAQRHLLTYDQMWKVIKEEAGIGLERVSKGDPPKYDRESFDKSSDLWTLNMFNQSWEQLEKEELTHLFTDKDDFETKRRDYHERTREESQERE